MTPADEIEDALLLSRKAFGAAFVFGFFINFLMLAVSIYSMQVFDRVLGSGSLDTLLMLTLVVGIALVFYQSAWSMTRWASIRS